MEISLINFLSENFYLTEKTDDQFANIIIVNYKK